MLPSLPPEARAGLAEHDVLFASRKSNTLPMRLSNPGSVEEAFHEDRKGRPAIAPFQRLQLQTPQPDSPTYHPPRGKGKGKKNSFPQWATVSFISGAGCVLLATSCTEKATTGSPMTVRCGSLSPACQFCGPRFRSAYQ